MSTLPYSIKVHDTSFHKVEIDGHGGVDIEHGYHDETVCLDHDDIRKMFIQSHAHRTAYQAYTARGYEDEEQYQSDYDSAIQKLTSALDTL